MPAQQLAEEMIRVFEAQRLVSLSTLFDLADNLESVTKGEKLNTALAGKLASRISDIQLPRSTFTSAERNSLAFGYYTEKHIDAQRKLNLRQAIEKAAADPNKLRDLRGTLAPFLRDTLVGYNYIHYAPPGAQILHTNPLFVRNHDFIGIQGAGQTWKSTEMFGTGWPANAGGQAGRLARFPALRARRGGTKFPDSVARAGAHLGRPGSANDSQRRHSPLVGRYASATPLGRGEYGLRRNAAGRKRARARIAARRCWPFSNATRRPPASRKWSACWPRAT